MKKNILITSFENFLDNLGNPTPLIAQDLEKHFKSILSVETLQLPVSFDKAYQKLAHYLQDKEFHYIFELGLASNRQSICLEKFALNYMYCPQSPDNDGLTSHGEMIIPTGNIAIENKIWDLENIIKELNIKGLDISAHAGTYVCNNLYYKSLGKNLPALFIHVPQIKEINPQSTFTRQDVVDILIKVISKLTT